MDIGALSLLISEKGFDATMAKVAALDAAAAKVGARVAELKVASPTAITVEAALARVGTTASTISARPTTLTLTLTGAQQAEAALGAIEAEKEAVASPAVIPVTTTGIAVAEAGLVGIGEAKQKAAAPATLPITTTGVPAVTAALADIEAEKTQVAQPVAIPITTTGVAAAETGLAGVADAKQQAVGPVTVPVTTTGVTAATEALAGIGVEKAAIAQPLTIPVTPPNVAPAVAAFTALAEAEGIQESRAIALRAALEAAGQASTSVAERVETLRGALAQDQAATDALSSATLQLDRAQRDGIDVIRLRAQAVSELADAQAALSRQSNIGTTRVRDEPLPTGQRNNIAIGPELGPATAEAEALAKRMAATKAAFEAEARAAQQAAAANAGFTTQTTRAGTETEKLSPKVRSAANGITALAFALTAGEPNFQTFALAAGLAGSSLADAFGSAKMATYASGIGAVLVVASGFVGILERMTDRAAKARTAVDEVLRSIQGIRSAGEAQAAVAVAERDLARATQELADARHQLTVGGDLGSIVPDIARLRTAQKEVEQYNEILMAARHQQAVTEITEATETARAHREVVVEGLAAEARARDAAQQAQVAREEATFATGRSTLERFFAARLALVRESTAREIAVLRARQNALAAPDPNATSADAERRAGEVRRINSQIAEAQSRLAQQETEQNEQRRIQRETLDRQILQFEQREADAAGDASEQRIAQAKLEAREIARALVQRSGATTPQEIAQAWADANEAAQHYVDTQTRVIRAQQQQQQAQRIFNGLEIERLTIQQQLARGEITQAEANDRLAAAERARIPDLITIASKMEEFGRALTNPDLINAARRLRAEITGMANAPLGPLAQQVKALRDELSVAAAEGDSGAQQILDEMQAEIDRNGGVLTVGIAVKARWALDLKRDIERQFALLEINLKPKNIVFQGVRDALSQLNQELSGLALNVGNAIGSSLAAGFSAAFTKGSGKNFAEAFGNALLSSIGNIMVQLGGAMVTYGLILSVASGLLAGTPFAHLALSAPTAIVAGTALIALGAGMGAIAANNTGTRTGGGGGRAGSSQRVPDIAPRQVILDPDRRLREARAVAPTPTVTDGNRQATSLAPFAPTYMIFGRPTPESVRWISDNNLAAGRRDLPGGVKRVK